VESIYYHERFDGKTLASADVTESRPIAQRIFMSKPRSYPNFTLLWQKILIHIIIINKGHLSSESEGSTLISEPVIFTPILLTTFLMFVLLYCPTLLSVTAVFPARCGCFILLTNKQLNKK
jgi:hypothetical protein